MGATLAGRSRDSTKPSSDRNSLQNQILTRPARQQCDSSATDARHVREESKSKNKRQMKKKVSMPDPLGEEMAEELLLRIKLRHSDEERRHHRGRLEQAVNALRMKGELSDNWERRIWGYLNQVDISEAKRAGKPHPRAMGDTLKLWRASEARTVARGTPTELGEAT
jgi:hypothetical protein